MKRVVLRVLAVALGILPAWCMLDMLGVADIPSWLVCNLVVLTPFALCAAAAWLCWSHAARMRDAG